MDLREPLAVRESSYRSADSLIEVEDCDFRRPVADDPTTVQISHTHTDCITIPDECEFLAICPTRHQFTLKDHIACLHVNLVEDPQWARPVLDHVGDGV